jgi:hypothetical protein
MTEYSSSPDRGSFYRGLREKELKEGRTTQESYDRMTSVLYEQKEKEKTMDKSFNLEYDLRSSAEMLSKARHSKTYSQNLYAALCNNRFFYGDKEWTCSWRHAGGIIADMRQEGDYIDWYCSGMAPNETGYVGESEVTDEIRLDLIKMGWTVKPYEHELENKNVR